ncbi:hypothetical protein [Absidia glauca]|uniref:Uncharacterized protein n=1 Tax=Absidia glauca TaxID=4829 RepID=A0A168PIR7_ABSGL|nr:hypothetical protein [Absidia glauca]
MTDSSLDMSTASLLSSQQLGDSQHTTDSNGSMYSSLPSLPSLPPIEIDAPYPPSSASSPSSPSSSRESNNTQPPKRPPLRHLMWGHVRSVSSVLIRNMFKDNNLPLVLNILGHWLAARQLWGKSNSSVARYTTAQPSALMTDQFRTIGVLHMALGLLAALALKERRLSTERTALWVLAVAAWTQSLVQGKAYLQSPALYTLKALQEWGALNGVLTVITTVALRNTVRRTGRLF